MILVYGGAFNPPTIAHKAIMLYLMDLYKPNQFIFLPVGDIYPKTGLISYQHRHNMLKCFCESDLITISDFEQQPAFKGSISALDHFKQLYQDDITFILGADNLKHIKSWIESDRLLTSYHFIVIDRDHQAKKIIKDLKLDPNRFQLIELDLKENASSFRQDPNAFKHYIDPCVLAYIKQEKLYEVTAHV
jgi:nicotinate-nucleotide adenylyltransferase